MRRGRHLRWQQSSQINLSCINLFVRLIISLCQLLGLLVTLDYFKGYALPFSYIRSTDIFHIR